MIGTVINDAFVNDAYSFLPSVGDELHLHRPYLRYELDIFYRSLDSGSYTKWVNWISDGLDVDRAIMRGLRGNIDR